MAYTTIDDPSAYFQVKTYTGTGSSLALTFDGNSDLQPDLVWVKSRTNAYSHYIYDSTRGVQKRLLTDTDAAESTLAQGLTAFGSNGMTFGTDAGANESSDAHVAWGWKANGGTTSSNSTGDITTTVQANTTAGFSIMTWTSNNADNQTLGHGLGAAPEVFWVKLRSAQGSWYCYHKEAGATHYISLNSNGAKVDNVIWGDTAPTSSVITVDTNSVSGSTPTALTYAWKEIQGFSKFGGYTGNGNTDGAFVYLGFKPALIIVRATDTDNWRMYDHKRANAYNVIDVRIIADTNAAESQDDNECDFLSNGVKWRSSSGGVNSSGQEYIYMAFAEHPFVSSEGVPTTAR